MKEENAKEKERRSNTSAVKNHLMRRVVIMR
jgi:hypothetical protein